MKFLPFVVIYLISLNLSAQSGNKTVWLDKLVINKETQDLNEPKRKAPLKALVLSSHF